MGANATEDWRWTVAHGQRLREVRIKKGISQKKGASLLGVSDDTLRNWETGATQPREEFLAAVAEFCDLSLEELVRSETELVPPPPPQPIADADSKRGGARRVRLVLLAITVAVALGVTSVFAVVQWRRANQFQELRPTRNGVEAISRSGRVLWRAVDVEPAMADRWVSVRAPDGRTLIATVLVRRGDHRPEKVSTLSLIEPNTRHLNVVRTVRLPSTGWTWFPAYARRYHLAYINAVDLNGDGIDEVLATYQQVPECVSYTILYEPANDRARIVFAHTGAHHFTGAWDLDGDGRRELLFLGINNGYNWMNALAAIRLKPAVGAALRPDAYTVTSPDSAAYLPHESAVVFYALLPRGKVPDDPAAVSWDAGRRLVSVRLLNGRIVNLTPFGFLAGSTSSRPEAERAGLRREAYRHNREARRLSRAGFAADAVAEARRAVSAADQSGDLIVLEAMQRDLAKILIGAGTVAEGEALGKRLALRSENASEIYYDLAVAFHLAGDLRRAVAYYEAGIRRGGSPEEGKSKHEFILGETLALVELGEFEAAEEAIDRFRARYVSGSLDWTAIYREYVTWQKGDAPNPGHIVLLWNTTDLQRYWLLEFRNTKGEPPAGLLRSVDALLAERNQPRGGLLSLRGVLLLRLGRHGEAADALHEAITEGKRDAAMSIIARGHVRLVEARDAMFRAKSS